MKTTIMTLTLLTLAACGSTAPTTAPASPQPTSEATGDAPSAAASDSQAPYETDVLVQSCMTLRERSYECREQLVDPMLDFRAEQRPNIAQAISTPEGRAEVREVAMAEYESDGAGDPGPRRQSCEAMVGMVRPSNQQIDQFASCEQQRECGAWVECVMPLIRSM